MGKPIRVVLAGLFCVAAAGRRGDLDAEPGAGGMEAGRLASA